MARRIVVACREGFEATIRACGEALSLAVIFVLALAPVAGAVAVSYVLPSWVMVTAILGAVGLGAVAFGRLGNASGEAVERAEVTPLSEENDPERLEVTTPPSVRRTNELVSFHDFNPARSRFDHW